MAKNIKKNDLSIYNNWFFNDTSNSGFELGLVQVYTGNGKGKTTAAIGQALRASGHNLKSVIIQFLKGGSYTGEFKIQKKLQPYFKIYQFGNPYFINKNCIREEDLKLNRNGFKLAFEIATQQNDIHILVLDEINVAANIGIIKIDEILNLIRNKRKDIELILTGRYASQEIIDAADLVTEMKEIKHYYNNNVLSRFGIEK